MLNGLLEPLELELLELLSAPTLTVGTGVPSLRTNAADGRLLVAAVHGGTTTSRVPPPCGSDNAVEPVVAITAFSLWEATFAPVAHGVTTTVRAASVGTTTRREPTFTLVVPLLLMSKPPITKIAISAAITDAATRFPGMRDGADSCSVSEPIAPPGVQLLLDDDGAVHGEAVAVEEPFDGTTVLCWPPELELLELELELELADSTQGGTISVVTPLFAGSCSSFCGVELELEAELFEPPPGVTKIVLAGGGCAELLLLELDELLEPVLVGGWQGWMATVSSSEPFGITSWLEPGGGLLLPLAWVT